VVVFDVNVYLDIAELLGAPFTWEKLASAVAPQMGSPCPHPTDSRIDSLRAVALCTSGRFAGDQQLEVWTSSHIDHLVVHKLTQPTAAATQELTGLGWDLPASEYLLESLVYDLVYDKSGGGSVGEVKIAAGSPPLSHEDGLVFRTALEAGEAGASSLVKYCITNDREFRKSEPSLTSEVLVLYPFEWVKLVRQARNKVALGRLLPGS
jgi:hypothetical protein